MVATHRARALKRSDQAREIRRQAWRPVGLGHGLNGRDGGDERPGVIGELGRVLQEPLLERFGCLRPGQLRLKVFLQMLNVIPLRIAQRTKRPIDQCQPALDEGAARDGLQQGRIGLERRDVLDDCRGFFLAERRKASPRLAQPTHVTKRRLLVEGGLSAALQNAGIEDRVGAEFLNLGKAEQLPLRGDGRHNLRRR